ncbi:uncharacterized protein LOC120354487 [Nilaparvata lugens]|uniref:uncharacterized protein LOC120354487 n=1 Tax=Nilaparvata lugens TaxID=108931 RepID=UPI00193CD864|nr:uncharacterized protein LOC120354487 [Nilaparvata lugens]
MNGTLQLLLAQKDLLQYLRECQESDVLSYPQEFWEFFEAVWDQQENGNYVMELKFMLNRGRLSYLCNGQQQDAAEFLSEFIQLLHELNPAGLFGSPNDGDSQSRLEWNDFLQYKSVSNMFAMQLEMRTRCTNCAISKRSYEHFKILTLHFPEDQVNGTVSFSSLLEERLKTTDMDRECEECGTVQPAIRKTRFRRCPPILVSNINK